MKTIRRRRMENRTDYKARFGLLKSEKPRLVIRKTNRYIIAQLVLSDTAQDKVIASVISKDLVSKGWPAEKSGSLKSLSAAYLTGLLLASKVKKTTKEAILDLGMQRNIKGSRIYAALKGFIDGGIKVPCSEDSLPKEEDLKKNEKVVATFEKIRKELNK